MKQLLTKFDKWMVAATFAEANAHEYSREYLDDGDGKGKQQKKGKAKGVSVAGNRTQPEALPLT